MLLKQGNLTLSVLIKGKSDPKYECSVYRFTKQVFSQTIRLDAWQDEANPLKEYLLNQDAISLWDQLNEEKIDSPGKILASVTEVKDYGVTSGVDITIGGDIFRLHKDGYISSKAFQIWYIATKKRIPAISEKEWTEFVTACLSIGKPSLYDPIAPEILPALIETIKAGTVHDDFCDQISVDVRANSNSVYFVYKEEESWALYVPKHITEGIRKHFEIGATKARQYWTPFLDPRIEDNHRVGTTVSVREQPRKRFWIFSLEKLVAFDKTLQIIFDKVIDCAAEHTENEEKKEKINITVR